jgi:hypothetical protein
LNCREKVKRKKQIEKDIRTRTREGKEWAFCRGLLGMESIHVWSMRKKAQKTFLFCEITGSSYDGPIRKSLWRAGSWLFTVLSRLKNTYIP